MKHVLFFSSRRHFLIGKALLSVVMVFGIASCTQVKSPTPASPPYSGYPASGGHSPVENVQRQQILEATFRVLGSPYRFGGTTPAGFDCSGLTRYVYQAANIAIPRTAAQQRDYSQTVPDYARLLPGDLIFFKTGRKTDHVGVYVGDGQFVHASTSKRRVLKTRLDTPYWRRTFVKFGTYIRSN